MVIPSLEGTVLRLFKDGLAPSSNRAYASATRRFEKFCQAFKIQNPFPLTEDTLCYFVSFLHKDGLKHQTIKTYLSGLRHAQIAMGMPEPFKDSPFPRLEYVLKGVKRQQAHSGQKPAPRLPITPPIIRKLSQFWEHSIDPDRAMLQAACCLGFFGFLRTAEFTAPPCIRDFDANCHLSLADVAVDSREAPSTIRIRIKQSKTDPFRQGVDIFLGRSHSDVCPVTTMTRYLRYRSSQPGPFFLHTNGQPLTRQSLVCHMRKALEATGSDPSLYNGHSFRIGAATTAAAKGIEDAIIQTLGRWQSTAYLRYVKIPRERLAAISQAMVS